MRTNLTSSQQRNTGNKRKDSTNAPPSNSLKRRRRSSSKEGQKQSQCTASQNTSTNSEEPPKRKRGRPRLKSNDREENTRNLPGTSKLKHEKETPERENANKSSLRRSDPLKQDVKCNENDKKWEKKRDEEILSSHDKSSETIKTEKQSDLDVPSKESKLRSSQKFKKEDKRNLRITSGRKSQEALAKQSFTNERSFAKATTEKSPSPSVDAVGCENDKIKSFNKKDTCSIKTSEKDSDEPSESKNVSGDVSNANLKVTEKSDSASEVAEKTVKTETEKLLTDNANDKNEKTLNSDDKKDDSCIKKNLTASHSKLDCKKEDPDKVEIKEKGSSLNSDHLENDSPVKEIESTQNNDALLGTSTIADPNITDEDVIKDTCNNNSSDIISNKQDLISDEQDDSNSQMENDVEMTDHLSETDIKHQGTTNEIEKEDEKLKYKSDSIQDENELLEEDLISSRSEIKSSSVESSVCSPTSSCGPDNPRSGRSGKGRQRGQHRPGIDFKIGCRLEACDFMQKWYPSKIVDVDWKDHEVLIHFERWSSRFDEWVSMDSPRLRAITRTSARKEHRQKLQQEFKIGDNVLAKWVDSKMYPAKIVIINTNGTCEVMFHDDGIQKLVKLANIQKITKDDSSTHQTPPSSKNTNLPVAEKKKSVESRSRSESKENKVNKASVRKDSPSAVDETSSNRSKGKNGDKSERNGRTKPMLKSYKKEKSSSTVSPSSSYGFMMKRKKLLVGGIFQAKRNHNEKLTSKKPAVIKRRQQQFDEEKSEQPKKSNQNKKNADTSVESGSPPSVDNADSPSKELASQPSVSSEENTSAEDNTKKRKPSGGMAPKEFIIEEDHNHFKCPIQECGKGFRKESLLASHMKHYHNKSNKKETHVRRKSDGDKPTSKLTPESKIQDEASPKKVEDTKEKIVKTTTPEIEKSVSQEVPVTDKTLNKPVESTPVRRGERQRKFSALAKELSGRRRKHLFNKNANSESKSSATPSQGKPSEQTSTMKRKIVPKEKSGSAINPEEIKGSFGFDCTVKDGPKKRKLANDAEKNISPLPVENIKEEPSSAQETVPEEPSITTETVTKCDNEPNNNESGTTKPPHRVRKPGRKRHLGINKSTVKEENSSAGGTGEKPSNENADNINYYDDDNEEEDARNEVVNCICRFKEEEGLMMQCENCMAWQHGSCFNIEEEEKVPEKYICFACRNPKAQRRGYKYWYEQSWWKTGEMASFNFLPKAEPSLLFQNSVLRSHALISSIQAVNRVLHSLRHKLHIAGNPDHPDLKHWRLPWTEINISNDANPSARFDHVNDVNQTQKGELAYTDHSYSAVNRNNDATSLSNSRVPHVDVVNSEVEPMRIDVEDHKTEEINFASPDSVTQKTSDGEVHLSTHDKENSFDSESVAASEIKPDSANASLDEKLGSVQTNISVNSESSLPEEISPNKTLDSPNRLPTNVLEKRADMMNNCVPKSNADDPILCQLNVLDHIEQMQEEVDRRLEEIAQHVEALESEWEVNYPNQKNFAGSLSVKKMLKMLENNLSKVKKMSLFS